jgi:hypothetical protein
MARLLRIPRASRSPTSRTRWTATLGAAVLALSASGAAQTAPPPAMTTPSPNQDLARQHLTNARNVLNDLTQLPAAGQLAGNPRRLVQQLITDFNAMLTISAGWHASYEKVDATLDVLLEPQAPEPAAGTSGAIGTSGASVAGNAIDPAIRAKLEEFRAHLDQFEDVASGNATPDPPPTSTPPPSDPPATTPPTAPPAIEDRPDAPPAPTSEPREDQDVSGVARDVLLHVEAVEVMLEAQTAAQKAATDAAGGAVVTSQTPSGSTRTTIAGPNVTLTDEQLARIRAHLKDIRLLLERK